MMQKLTLGIVCAAVTFSLAGAALAHPGHEPIAAPIVGHIEVIVVGVALALAAGAGWLVPRLAKRRARV